MAARNGIRFALVASAVAAALLAQTLLNGGHALWAAALFLAAVSAFTYAVADLPGAARWRSRRDTGAAAQRPLRLRVSGWATESRFGAACGVVCALAMLGSLRAFAAGPPNTAGWWLFGISAVALLVALPAIDGRWTPLVRRLRSGLPLSISPRALLEIAALCGVLLLAFAVRVYGLRELPLGLWYDEAANLEVAVAIALDPGSAPVFATTLPTLYLLPAAALIAVLGPTAESLRLASVAFSLAGIVAVFLLARHMAGPLAGWTAAFVLAVSRWDLNFSRIGMHGVTMSLTTALAAWLTLRATQSGRLSDYGLAGAALGLGMWFYAAFRLFPLVVAVVLLLGILAERPPLRQLAARLALMAVAAFVMAAPVAQFATVDSDQFLERTRASSLFSVTHPGESVGAIVDGLRSHALMFNLEGDANPRHNLPGAPMLDTVSGALLALGLAACVFAWWRSALIILPFWLAFMLLPGALAIPWEAPQALRAIGVLPAVAILVALAICALWQAGRASPWPLARRLTPFACCALIALIAFLNLGRYFGEQASDPRVYAAFSTDETLIGRDMRAQLGRGYTLFTSRQFQHSLGIRRAAGSPRYEVLRAPIDVPMDAGRVGAGAAIYLEPREESVYRLLKLYYPDAHFEEARPPSGGEPMYYLASISREQLEAAQGLQATYTPDVGETRSAMRLDTQVAWAFEVGPDAPPFDFAWTGALHVAEPGEYGLKLESTEKAEVLLNGLAMLSGERAETTIRPALGVHVLQVRGRVEDGGGTLRLLWRPPGEDWSPIPASRLFRGEVRAYGLDGHFYALGDDSETFAAARVTPSMDVFWYDPPTPEPYRVVWEGTLDAPESGEYGFTLEAHGELSLTIDGDSVARFPPDDDTPHAAAVYLSAGEHAVRVEYVSERPPSQFAIYWTPPNGEYEPLPIERLTPAPQFTLEP